MPKPFKSKAYSRKDVDIYHGSVVSLIAIVRHWPKDSNELQDFLDRETLSLPEPMDYTIFREKFKVACNNGIKVGLYENQIGEEKLRELARRLYSSSRRRDYYARVLNERHRRPLDEECEPVSLVELEQRYQHYLYKKARKHRYLGLGPKFEVWRTTDACFTFYDI